MFVSGQRTVLTMRRFLVEAMRFFARYKIVIFTVLKVINKKDSLHNATCASVMLKVSVHLRMIKMVSPFSRPLASYET